MARKAWFPAHLYDLIEIKHGFAFEGESFSDEPAPDVLLTPGNFAIGGGFKADKFKYYIGPIPEEYVLAPGDLIVTMTDLSKASDTLGYPALVPASRDKRYLHNQRLGKIIIRDESQLDKLFLYYLLRTEEYRNEVLASASGSVIKHTSPDRIRAYRFSRPPLPKQRAIAHILGTLDDKIELNRRMNETLEAMARALFKSWFVDFDPVRAKAEGRQPYGMDAETAALFPASFEDSPLGDVPSGWKVQQLGDVLAVLETGFRPKGGATEAFGGIPSVGAESIVKIGHYDFGKTKYVPIEFFNSMKRGLVENHDVLLYKDGGRPGEFEPHVSMFGDGFPFKEFCINEHVYRLRTTEALSQAFLYFWLESEAVMEEMRNRGTGVAIPGLNSTALRGVSVLVPDQRILQAFTRIVEPLIKRIFGNSNESRTLATLRDALLPKLLSGEVRVR